MKGSIRKRGNVWSYRIDLGIDPKTGKRKQKRGSGFKRKKDAEAALAKVNTELISGMYVSEKEITFKGFAYQWLDDYIGRNNVKPGTVRIRKHEINRLLDYLSELKMKDITRTRYQSAINKLCDRFSNNTMSGVYNTGKAIFRKAVEWEVIKKNPTEFTHRRIKKENREELPNYMEKEQLALFLKTVDEHGLPMDKLIFYTLAYTGVRIGELIALRWDNILFNSNTLEIKKTLYNPNNNVKGYMLVDTKTKTSKRDIYIDDVIVDLFKNQRKHQNEIKLLYQYEDRGFVFANENGLPMLGKTITSRLKRLLKIADLDTRLTLHSFRHTHVSLMAEAKVSLEAIMERMGHKSDEVTKSVYLHVTKKVKEEASHKFVKLMKDFM